MEKTDWKRYLQKERACSCGKSHFCDIEEIVLEEHGIRRLPEILGRHTYKKLCVVCDEHTEVAAGFQVYEALAGHGYEFSKVLYHEPELIPNEDALIYLFTQVPQDCDLIIGVGSGTINDLCRYVSYKMKIDYYIVGTAPSMDGYASNVSPLIIRHLKTTYTAKTARVIIGDLDVLCKAPMHMIAAGVGDIIGKYVCLADWQLAHQINGEYLCPEVVKMVQESIQKVTEHAQAAAGREKEAIAAIMEGLVLSGIAMSYIGNSRPASGSEHHMSHYWEMMFLLNQEPDPLHGTKVGVATIAALRLYEMLKETELKSEAVKAKAFSYDVWAKEIEAAYGSAASGVLQLDQEVEKNSDKEVLRRQKAWEEKQEEIGKILEHLPKTDTVADVLKSMKAPVLPKEIGVSPEIFKKGIYYAKDLRNRFGLLQILFDFQLQEKFGKKLEEELYR